MIRVLLVVLFVALLAGCGAAPTATAARVSVVDAPVATSIPAEPAPTARPAGDLVVRLERSGGITGRTTTYSIRADGSVQIGAALVRDAAATLPAPSKGALADLLASIAAANISSVPPDDYSPQNACCDRYAYTLSLWLDSGEYSYSTVEAAQNQPAALDQVIGLVQAYIEAAQ